MKVVFDFNCNDSLASCLGISTERVDELLKSASKEFCSMLPEIVVDGFRKSKSKILVKFLEKCRTDSEMIFMSYCCGLIVCALEHGWDFSL